MYQYSQQSELFQRGPDVVPLMSGANELHQRESLERMQRRPLILRDYDSHLTGPGENLLALMALQFAPLD
jgi:hypothetical protein